jgi:hypothetical protein
LTSEKGDKCLEKAKNLYPTQFAVGGLEVDCKANRYSEMSQSELEKKLEDEIVPVVISQDRYYVLDGHHLTQALLLSGWGDLEVTLEIVDNWNDLSFPEFELAMTTDNIFYLYNSGNGPISPTLIPPFNYLDDDMFRTLAWLVREAGGFDKGNVMYCEFIWADFLRSNMLLPTPASTPLYCNIVPYSPLCIPDQKKLLESWIQPALELALSDRAKNLPGWHQGVVDAPNCGAGFDWNYGPWNGLSVQAAENPIRAPEELEYVTTGTLATLAGQQTGAGVRAPFVALIVVGSLLLVAALAGIAFAVFRRRQFYIRQASYSAF